MPALPSRAGEERGGSAENRSFRYADHMCATGVVYRKAVRFKLSPALAGALRENRRKMMTEPRAVAFVEAKRARALRRTKPLH